MPLENTDHCSVLKTDFKLESEREPTLSPREKCSAVNTSGMKKRLFEKVTIGLSAKYINILP
jgi:hypothetical protein